MIELPKTAIQENERTYQNPNNAIFIDKINNKVYKFGLWLDTERCIRNEFIAYTILLKKDGAGINIHYPEMHDCQRIKGTKYAMVILEYIPNIQMICFSTEKNNYKMNYNSNNNNRNNNKSSKCNDSLNNISRSNLITQAFEYLNNLGINHNDEKENLFVHSKNGQNNQKTFLWMDFEAATFTEEQLNMCSKLLLQNNVQISYVNSHHTSNILNNESPKKKTKPSPFASWINNEEN